MRSVETIFVLLMIVIVLAVETRPKTREWTTVVRVRDVELQLALHVERCLEIRFQGDLSQSRNSISSFEVARQYSCGGR